MNRASFVYLARRLLQRWSVAYAGFVSDLKCIALVARRCCLSERLSVVEWMMWSVACRGVAGSEPRSGGCLYRLIR